VKETPLGARPINLEDVWLVDFDDIPVWILKEDLVPTGDGPTPVVRIPNAKLIALFHKTFDIIGSKAIVASCHRIDELAHFEASIKITFGPVKFNIPISKEVHCAIISVNCTMLVNPRVLFVVDCA
jgi:hypothetical protein